MEEETNYRTPIGKVIKHLNTLCKKPQIDDQLEKALNLFNQTLDEQEKYLINGIFKINFSEAALFLQSAAEFYGKRIDLLWDQLLEFHTRLIKYDCEHQREKGAPVDQEVIQNLEERRNRYKRKKKFKLVLQSSEAQQLAEFIFDKENQSDEVTPEDDDSDDESQVWKELESKSAEMRKIPNAVYKQMTQKYRLKNYHVLKCQDFEIWDPEDDEFNTKYSRVPGWHHILHLFEYNDKGLLPDKNNTIARLRLTAYGRIKFLISRKIPLGTPFEEYKEEYLAYRQKFFEEEAKKWQNMPLDTLEDLHKQLQYLVQKEREEHGETACDDNIELGRYSVKNINREVSGDKIELLDNSDEDSLFELSFSCDKEFMRSDLFVRLEKLSSEIINTKLRQDSGFYDFNSDSDNDCDNESPAAGQLNAEAENSYKVAEDVAADTNTDNTDANNQEAGADITTNNELNEDTGNISNNQGASNDITNNELNQDTNDISNQIGDASYALESIINEVGNCGNLDHDETRSFISDHDYCNMAPPILEPEVNRNSTTANMEPKEGCNSSVNMEPPVLELEQDCKFLISIRNNTNEVPKTTNRQILNKTAITLFLSPSHITPRNNRIAEKKEKQKINRCEDSESPPKRRKLSMKQVEKLLQSKINPVKELKFEKFFSMNYQPQLGEGEIPIVEYESEESDMENLDDEPQLDQNQPDDNQSIHSRQDDTRSIFSDHDYCQSVAEETFFDSGFIDNSNIEAPSASELIQENSTIDTNGSPNVTAIDPQISLEDEYERLLAMLRESRKDQDTTESNRTSPTEQELRDKERKEAQARVEEWRSSINPILRNLKEHDFDIHEYGSRIMDNMEINETKPFKNIVQGKSSADVVRYFISSLQLANTYNIDICGAQQGQLSNDTFNVKLITKDRYHEHLDDFLAPSEETFKEKLANVRAMKTKEQSKSGEPVAKKLKSSPTPKGKKIYIKNNLLVRAKRTRTVLNKIPEDSPYALPSTSTSETTVQSSFDSTLIIEHVQDENNGSLSTYQAKPLYKGKSIIKRPVMREKSPNMQLLTSDSTATCTSLTYPAYCRSVTDEQIPSTSYQRFSPSPKPDGNQTRSPNGCTSSSDEGSPDQRRRESSEDSFHDSLMAAQQMNPYIQLQSTPHGPPPTKRVKRTSKQSISLE